jgi:hypothetical protein
MEQSSVTRRGLLRATIIEWDGTQVPEELKQLPPGRYVIEYVEELDELTPEEDAGIRAALDDLEAGHEIPYEEAMRELRAGLPSE